jgi:hypothetical protein
MSNVIRPIKTRYVNIDTRFRDDYDSSVTSNYVITLPQRIQNVKSLKVTNIESPFSYYNISEDLKNNTIQFQDNTGTITVYTIPDGFYTPDSLATYFSNNPPNSYISYSQSSNFSQFIFSPDIGDGIVTMFIQFSVDDSGNFDRSDVKKKVGWLLGFRKISYFMKPSVTTITSESFIDLNGPRYMYVAIDEFTQNTSDNTFLAPLYKSIINKNIMARVCPPKYPLTNYTFGNSVFQTNNKDGTLLSDTRSYPSVDLHKIRVELLDESGHNLNLNGLDFSLCLEVEYEA